MDEIKAIALMRSMLNKPIKEMKDDIESITKGATAHQQLVTDADGNVKWEDKTHYKKDRITLKLSPKYDKASTSSGRKWIGGTESSNPIQIAAAKTIAHELAYWLHQGLYEKWVFYWDGDRCEMQMQKWPILFEPAKRGVPFGLNVKQTGDEFVFEVMYNDDNEHTLEFELAEPELKQLDEDFIPDTIARKSDVERLTEEIAELKGEMKEPVTYTPDQAGSLRVDSGAISITTNHTYHTDYIPLDGYERIVAKTHVTASYYALAFFDASKTLLPDVSIIGAGVITPNEIDMTVPEGAAYCMLSNYLGADGVYLAHITLYPEDAEVTLSTLFGKKIAFLGDSITTTSYATPNYWQLIEERTGCKALNYGKGQSRFATVAGDNAESFLSRAAVMDTSADAVFVMGGTNDCGLKTLLGEWNSEDVSTFYGALNALISLLRTNYPGKPIIFTTPMKRKYDTDDGAPDTMADLKTASATEEITMQHCVLAIKAKCARHGIPVVDIAEHSGIGAECAEYFVDNLHPSALGYVRIANMVQAELEKQFTHTAG